MIFFALTVLLLITSSKQPGLISLFFLLGLVEITIEYIKIYKPKKKIKDLENQVKEEQLKQQLKALQEKNNNM